MGDNTLAWAFVVFIVIMTFLIICKPNIAGFNSGGLSTVNALALYDTPSHCFVTPDGGLVCTSTGTLML